MRINVMRATERSICVYLRVHFVNFPAVKSFRLENVAVPIESHENNSKKSSGQSFQPKAFNQKNEKALR